MSASAESGTAKYVQSSGNESADALLSLADRCEQATGPDIDLERDIAKALGAGQAYVAGNRAWHFTASLDAAMTLVPDSADGGWRLTQDKPLTRKNWAEVWLHEDAEPGDGFFRATAATPALALCAAALRARAADRNTQDEKGLGG